MNQPHLTVKPSPVGPSWVTPRHPHVHVSVALIVAACGLSLILGVGKSWAGDLAFTNQTSAAGISVSHSPTFGDSFLAGGAVGDFDGDGWQDIFYPAGGGASDRLYMNNGDGTFTDRAAEWGVADNHQGTSAAVGDYDGDGWLDLFVSSFSGNRLYHNDGGAGFTNMLGAAGIGTISPYGGAFGDYDLDGDLDLAIVSWSTSSENRLFRNDGDGTFTDVTASSGVGAALGSIVGFTVRFADMNGDRYPELLWVGDFGTSEYLINDGDGTFTNATASAGVGFDGTEMGHTVADFNRDGLFDWYVTTISTNNLYMNLGNHTYQERATISGVDFTGWGWGTVAVDFDHDLRIDIAATSQGGGQFLYRNISTDVTASLLFQFASVGFASSVSGRGLSHVDYDNDGDYDLLVFPNQGGLQLFRNDLSGDDIHWIKLFLEPGSATDVPPHGVGTVVYVTVGGETLMSRMDAGNNYLSQSEMSVHFGLGSFDTIEELRVEWPNGDTTIMNDVAADQALTLLAAPIATPSFVRGDINADGNTDIADAVFLLSTLFSGGDPATCDDAADTNDDGSVDISDAIAALGALFSATPLAPPITDCGLDPTADSLECVEFSACP